MNADSSFGHWKAKGGDCKLYSNSPFTGWRTTYEYCGGQAPHDCKATWIMQKYWMSQTVCENSKQKVYPAIYLPESLLADISLYFLFLPNLLVNCLFGWATCRKPAHFAKSFLETNNFKTVKRFRKLNFLLLPNQNPST